MVELSREAKELKNDYQRERYHERKKLRGNYQSEKAQNRWNRLSYSLETLRELVDKASESEITELKKTEAWRKAVELANEYSRRVGKGGS